MSYPFGRLIGIGVLFLAVLSPLAIRSRARSAGAGALKQQLERLRVVGSVLMIAAHPDDENTAVLAWCAQERKLRTGYLSLTRGEGGQNLIGSEQGVELGVIRTQELLAARRIDGAEQFFTRAIDFGYSKTAEETMAMWGREKVLGDIVRVVRCFRPDVIILRFSGTSRDGHGHHQTSAMLGKEAFYAAADPKKYPELGPALQPWQAKRAVWNGFAFNRQQQQELDKYPQPRVQVDTGAYNPVLGVSYGELAGLSRSQHRSQGMGAPERRGSAPNYFFTVAGEPATKELFDGIDLTWNRLPGGAAVDALLQEASAALSFEHPEAVAPALLKARDLMEKIDHPDARRKLVELDEAITSAAGLWLGVSVNREFASPGSAVNFNLTAVNRSSMPLRLAAVRLEGLPGLPAFQLPAGALEFNKPLAAEAGYTLPQDAQPSEPYWLQEPPEGAQYRVKDPSLIGKAENDPVVRAVFHLEVDGRTLTLTRPVDNRYVDRVRGEQTRPFVVVPAVSLALSEAALVFPGTQPRKVPVTLSGHGAPVSGKVALQAPAGWTVRPADHDFSVASDESVVFEVTPPPQSSRGTLQAVATVGGRQYRSSFKRMVYDHIPPQTLMPAASTPVTRADVRVAARRVGYVMGAGDQVPDALRQMGCEVQLLEEGDLAAGAYAGFDAVVTGVRAWNTRADLRMHQKKLWDFLESGGTVVVQYNVMDGLFWSSESGTLRHLGPWPLKIARDRVSVEEAPVKILRPDHSLLNQPNRITTVDFEGWVQERGLYFPADFDSRYETLLEMNDPKEKPLLGGILTAKVGKGVYVFTPLSFFRQLPAGVPGAYRLFANLVSGGKAAH